MIVSDSVCVYVCRVCLSEQDLICCRGKLPSAHKNNLFDLSGNQNWREREIGGPKYINLNCVRLSKCVCVCVCVCVRMCMPV